MSKLNILAGLTLASALMAAPAYAGGKHTVVNKGPAPLKERVCADGTKGYYDAQGRFICPVRTVTPAPRTTYVPPRQTYTPPRTTTPVRTVAAPAPRPAPAAPTVSLAGLVGGVGLDIGTGFIGGGNGLFIDRNPGFSGVLSAPAAAFAFNQPAPQAAAPAPAPAPKRPQGGKRGGMGGGKRGGMSGNGGKRGGMGGGKRGGMGGGKMGGMGGW